MGIVYIKDSQPFVFEAIEPVRLTPFRDWVARGDGGHYVVKRLRDVDRLMTDNKIGNLKTVAAEFQGKPYDLAFEWSDHRIYCSELVWKIYDRGMGVQVGHLKKLRDFDLSSDAVRNKMKERYGDQVPLDETVVSPGDMFLSDLLVTVSEQ